MNHANFLIIEEPEAHIHTHIQKSLFDKINFSNTQVIYSTHSSHISEASNVESTNILGKVGGEYQAFQPTTGLSPSRVGSIQRYLDAVRSNLLFAKSVVLVEGDAEEILIPTLIKKVLGFSLDELGISLVNIRSTGFENVASLFHDTRVRKKCSIITDSDATFFDTTEVAGDTWAIKRAKKKAIRSGALGLARKTALDAFCKGNPWINPFYAPHTFEVDLIAVGNEDKFVSILEDVYTDSATLATSKTELESGDIDVFGKRALTMATHSGKGWFAIILAKNVDHNTLVPTYILDAIAFAHGSFGEEAIFKMLSYRLLKIVEDTKNNQIMVDNTTGQANQWYIDWRSYLESQRNSIATFKLQLQSFQSGLIEISQLRDSMRADFPNDLINSVLDRV